MFITDDNRDIVDDKYLWFIVGFGHLFYKTDYFWWWRWGFGCLEDIWREDIVVFLNLVLLDRLLLFICNDIILPFQWSLSLLILLPLLIVLHIILLLLLMRPIIIVTTIDITIEIIPYRHGFSWHWAIAIVIALILILHHYSRMITVKKWANVFV